MITLTFDVTHLILLILAVVALTLAIIIAQHSVESRVDRDGMNLGIVCTLIIGAAVVFLAYVGYAVNHP